ncbi:AsmA family protein [Pseudomaricurvus sp. HS19]|uniref:AsmA family protein n=1 Tax=Pseudomaricurvus sp. HS19 TaxID=2692626 RepID=UPI00136E08E8|nr:AsmA family protein [Pseudomaricurvus sp. HS19]MYM62514.1 AsmA family protein [Pseudomaricurvus sp. HS19]
MKAIKIAVGALVAIIAVVAVVVVLALQNLDKIIKAVVEDVGPKVVGTDVQLQGVVVQLKEGLVQLDGLTIHNPQGFSDNSIFSLGTIGVQLDTSALGGDVIVIKEVVIDQMELLSEFKTVKDNNLQALLNNVKQNTASSESKPAEQKPAEPAAEGSDVKLAIEHFRFAESKLTIQSDQYGEEVVKMPTIDMKNLGTKENGLTPEQLGQVVIERLTNEAKRAAQKRIEAIAKEKAKAKLDEKLNENLDDEEKEQLNQLKGLFGK